MPVDLLRRPRLSPREREVLLAWLRRDTKIQVCRDLIIHPGTLNTHLDRIRDKYAAVGRPARTKAALLARALQDRLLTLEEL